MVRQFLYWNADDDVEDIGRYSVGGFHPISLGDVVSSKIARYRVLHKLGRGAWSTVWLAEVLQDQSQRYVALRICVADADPEHELEIYNRLTRTLPAPPNVLQLQDHFVWQGPNGVHTVLVQNVLGSLLDLVRSPKAPGRKHMRTLCRDITTGLAAMHLQGIVHGDLHPENVGIFLPNLNNHSPDKLLNYFGRPECTVVLPTIHPVHPGALPQYLVPPISITDYLVAKDKDPFQGPFHAEIMDLGNSIILNERIRPACTPAVVCAPELMFERVAEQTDPRSPPTRASDIWSLACTIYELVFGSRLFHFAAQNDVLLGKMAILCGEVPQGWKMYWESRERLRSLSVSHATAEAEWNNRFEHFTKKSGAKCHAEDDVTELFALLRSMLTIDPTRRPSAQEVLRHPWFSGRASV